ncbi:hypothetical protein AXK60_17495 [Tsukamurella pseudospumae]|uniref:LppX_LprAFG lipoprotein n=1 Tax=Tsukamurella pseudospumae TaxID=239498 RepID=A0A137ZZI0_9ACTN|nr:hypothetical protein AXK60_17495 [Tsukamurella pseudospumae]
MAIIATVAAATLGFTACTAGEADGTPAGSATTDVTALVQSALSTARAVESVHFVLTTSGSLERQQVISARGDLVVRPKTSAKGTAVVRANGDADAQFVLVDDTMYADIGGKGFVAHRAGTAFYDVGALFDPKDGIPDILEHLGSAAIAGDEQIDGTATTRVTGTAKASDLAELAGIRAAYGRDSAPAPTTIWIQKSAPHHVIRISGAPRTNTEVRVDLSGWGVRPDIAAPTTRAVPSGPTSPPPGATAKPAK